MLLPTGDPGTFRAIIPLSEQDNRRTEAEVIVRTVATGLSLKYVGNRVYTRPYAGAAWDLIHTYQADLRPGSALTAMLESAAYAEIMANTKCYWEAPDAT